MHYQLITLEKGSPVEAGMNSTSPRELLKAFLEEFILSADEEDFTEAPLNVYIHLAKGDKVKALKMEIFDSCKNNPEEIFSVFGMSMMSSYSPFDELLLEEEEFIAEFHHGEDLEQDFIDGNISEEKYLSLTA